MGVERWRVEHWRSNGRRPRHGTAADCAPSELSERFDAVVGPLARDESWNRRLRSVRRRHRAHRAACWVLHGFAELGCWFTGVPAQRCTRRRPTAATGDA